MIVSILVPMILTNFFFFWSMEKESRVRSLSEMENAAGQIEYEIKNSVKDVLSIADYLDHIEGLSRFLKRSYKSDADYYKAYNELMENNIIRYYYSAQSTCGITIFTDNSTIVNGMYFVNKKLVENLSWYRKFIRTDKDYMVYYFYEDGYAGGYIPDGRHIVVLKKLGHFGGNDIAMLDLDYTEMQKNIIRMAGDKKCFIYSGDYLLASSDADDDKKEPFEIWNPPFSDGRSYEKECDIYGASVKLLICDEGRTWASILGERLIILVFLYLFNLILPALVLIVIYHSINDRLAVIGENIELIKNDRYEEIDLEESRDEIGVIVQSYNLMVGRIRELIETVFKNKEREQELLLAKKQAEIHALQSQINPHFMFNALESIRMHSLIKNETETVRILENFSVLLRENIQWNSNEVTVAHEADNVRRYLELQQYRFGDRLSFSINVQKECEDILIPKFSIITFVENSCVHGIEGSIEGGSISLIVSKNEGLLYIEIMDSGSGMTENELSELRERIESAGIDYLEKATKSIGIVNTVIRLRQIYGEKLYIDINSSKSGGTEICIVLPLLMEDGG